MRFGEIIKRAWHITWHYRWLWVLGLFAGITGGSGSAGGGSGGGGGDMSSFTRSFGSGSGTSGGVPSMPDWNTIAPMVQYWIPFIAIVVVLLVLIGLAFAVIGIGARGGLIWAVNEIEEGRPARLGEAWNAGFTRFWSLLGLGILLQAPLVVAGLLLAAVILVPIFGPLLRGDTPNPALVIAPMCGGLAIGVPILIVAGVVLGIMYITGARFIVINGMPTMHAAGEGWRAFRARIGDHTLMYFISLGLSIVAGLAFAIPIVVVALATLIPAGVAAASRNWGLFAGMIVVFVIVVFILSFLYSAVWGTFTSALWTIFFRRLTGREVRAEQPVAFAPPAPPAGQTPVQPFAPAPSAYQPQAAPAEPEAPAAPPMYVPPVPATPPAPPAQPAPFAPPAPAAPSAPTDPPAPDTPNG